MPQWMRGKWIRSSTIDGSSSCFMAVYASLSVDMGYIAGGYYWSIMVNNRGE